MGKILQVNPWVQFCLYVSAYQKGVRFICVFDKRISGTLQLEQGKLAHQSKQHSNHKGKRTKQLLEHSGRKLSCTLQKRPIYIPPEQLCCVTISLFFLQTESLQQKITEMKDFHIFWLYYHSLNMCVQAISCIECIHSTMVY